MFIDFSTLETLILVFRTNPLQPHGSSRMSCYLNFGIVSIFKLVHEVKLAQASKVPGADKFEEEIVKWREMSYAHAFSRGDYDRKESVPLWAIKWINDKVSSSVNDSFNKFDTEILESGTTDSEKWNAMQGYLVMTGELHNNVRMTWGKQIVAWGLKSDHRGDPAEEILRVLVYLNDRYALDGLSPPSYAGLLWCVGWCDGPDAKGGIRMKHAASYKLGSTAFKEAEENLLREQHQTEKRLGQLSIISSFQKQNKKRKEHPTIADETG
jgi:deoxyribodipyrimidine photolyase